MKRALVVLVALLVATAAWGQTLYTFPAAGGDTTNLVPYTGGTADLSLGTHALGCGGITIDDGFIPLKSWLFNNASGHLQFTDDNGNPLPAEFGDIYEGGTLLSNKYAAKGSGGGDFPIGAPATLPASGSTQIFFCYAFTGAIPAMSSNTSPSGTVTASSIYGGDTSQYYVPYSGGGNGWISDGSAMPQWTQYQFASGNVVIGYGITPWSLDAFPDRTPYTWKFQGSSNGTDWVDLDSRTAYTGWASNTLQKFWISGNTTSYSYYRLYVTAVRTGSILGIKTMQVYTAGADYDMYVRDSSNNVKKVTLTVQ